MPNVIGLAVGTVTATRRKLPAGATSVAPPMRSSSALPVVLRTIAAVNVGGDPPLPIAAVPDSDAAGAVRCEQQHTRGG